MKAVFKIVIGILLVLAIIIGGAAWYTTTQFDPNQYKTIIADQVQKTIGRKLTLNGPITLSVFPKIQVALSDASLSNAEWAGATPIASIKDLKVALELLPLFSKQMVVDGITLDGGTLNLVQQGNQNNWTFASATPAPVAAQATNGKTTQPAMALPQIQSVEIKNTTINYTVNGKTTVVAIDDAKSALALSKPVSLVIKGNLNQTAFNMTATGGTLGEIIANAEKWPVKGSLQLAGTKLTFDGALQHPQKFGGANFQISADGDGKDMAPLTGAALPFGKFSAGAMIAMTGTQQTDISSLKFSTGQTNVNGDLKINAASGKPNVTGTITIPVLNLADFAANTPQQKQSWLITSAHAAEPVIPAIAIPADGLRTADANIALDIAQIANGSQNMGAFSGNINLSAGVLQVTPMKLQYGGNTFTGDATLDGRTDTPQLTLNINSPNLDYGKLLSEMKINDKITGTGSLALNFEGAGKDTRAIAADSHGSFKLSSNQGQFDANVLFGQVSNITNMLGYQIPTTAKLNCASIEFDGTNGVWSSRQSAVDADTMSLLLTGDVNLADEQLNLKAAPDIKTAKANGLAPTIKIAGSLTQPSITTDGTSVTQSVLAAAKLGNNKYGSMLSSFIGGGKSAAGSTAAAPAGSCLAAVQKSASGATPPATTSTSTAAPSKSQQLNNAISGGLKNLLGK